ncbi:MAG: hypothetical protein IIC84_03250 [Chloroflexi bacterium]|nr:hypothetical protein [Chloroflexota bacterium]
MADILTDATLKISEEDLKSMVLEKEQLPEEFKQFKPGREGPLDNVTMAEQGFPGSTEESFRDMGRITGYMREFASSSANPPAQDGTDIMVATVVHLFDDAQVVSKWMTDVFVKQFEDNVGKSMPSGQELIAIEHVVVNGFYDEVVALRATQTKDGSSFSSTIIDFRLGRLLGVAFVVTSGDVERTSLAEQVAVELERNIVKAVLR